MIYFLHKLFHSQPIQVLQYIDQYVSSLPICLSPNRSIKLSRSPIHRQTLLSNSHICQSNSAAVQFHNRSPVSQSNSPASKGYNSSIEFFHQGEGREYFLFTTSSVLHFSFVMASTHHSFSLCVSFQVYLRKMYLYLLGRVILESYCYQRFKKFVLFASNTEGILLLKTSKWMKLHG